MCWRMFYVYAAIEFGRLLKDGPYWMNLFAGEQMSAPLTIGQMMLIQT